MINNFEQIQPGSRPESEMKHKLAVIFYADVADYSRLTGEDEIGTHQRVMHTLDYVSNSIKSSSGTVLRYAGDAILAEFSSVTAALTTAQSIQIELNHRNATRPNAQQVQIRIGINIGEVIQDRGEIYGDGVNLATRLEGAAEPGGVCISALVHDQVAGKLDMEFIDGDFESFKNINKPIHVYRWVPDVKETNISNRDETDTTPSIYIEAFSYLPENVENQVFTKALNDQLMLRISRRTGIRILETHTGSDLNPIKSVDYLLQGQISRLSSQLRVNLSMISNSTSETIWAQCFSQSLEDPLSFIDEITDAVDAELRTQINAYDAGRLNSKLEQELGLSGLLIKAAECFYRANMNDWCHATGLIDKALSINPEHSMAIAMRVEAGVLLASVVPSCLHSEDDCELLKMADHAIELDNRSDYAFFARGFYKLLRTNDFQAALADANQSIILSPSYVPGLCVMGYSLMNLGQNVKAIKTLKRAVELSKNDPFLAYYTAALATTQLVAGNFDEALENINLALQLHTNVWTFHRLKATILLQQGKQSASQWFDSAAELINKPHPFSIQHALPAPYSKIFETDININELAKPKLRIVND